MIPSLWLGCIFSIKAWLSAGDSEAASRHWLVHVCRPSGVKVPASVSLSYFMHMCVLVCESGSKR